MPRLRFYPLECGKAELFLLLWSSLIVVLPFVLAGGKIFITSDNFPSYRSYAIAGFNDFFIFRESIEIFFGGQVFDFILVKLLNSFTNDPPTIITVQTLCYRIWAAICWLLLGKELGLKNKYLALLIFCGMFCPGSNNSNISWNIAYFVPGIFFSWAKLINSQFTSRLAIIVFSISAVGFCQDFPNPKFLFYATLNTLLIFSFFYFLNKRSNIAKNIRRISFPIFTIILTLGIYPLLFLLFTPVLQDLSLAPTGYGNAISARLLDANVTTISAAGNGFHSNISNNAGGIRAYQGLNFSGLITALLVLYFYRNELVRSLIKPSLLSTFIITYLLFTLFFLGPNGPFGFLYTLIVKNIPVFTFLRTTSGSVFFINTAFLCITLYLLNKYPISRKVTTSIVSLLIINSALILDFRGYDSQSPSTIGREFPSDLIALENALEKNEKGPLCARLPRAYMYADGNQIPSSILSNVNRSGRGLYFFAGRTIPKQCEYVIFNNNDLFLTDELIRHNLLFQGTDLSVVKLYSGPSSSTVENRKGLARTTRYTAVDCDGTSSHCSFEPIDRFEMLREWYAFINRPGSGQYLLLPIVIGDLLTCVLLLAFVYQLCRKNKNKVGD